MLQVSIYGFHGYIEYAIMPDVSLGTAGFQACGITELWQVMKQGKMIYTADDGAHRKKSAYLVGIQRKDMSRSHAEVLFDELRQLAGNTGVEVAGGEIVKLRQPGATFLTGKGKAEEISGFCRDADIDMIIFDGDLSSYQLRNWERLSGLKVIDRSQVIIEIFAQRAVTLEAKLQVKLASLKYNLPRLAGAWGHLGRQAGGTGSGHRGEGEQQIELDRRFISDEIRKVEKSLEEVRSSRSTQRKNRQRRRIPAAAVVGYTNAGKSSLLNRLTSAGVLEDDKLFATLDPSTKPVVLPDKQILLLSDTVGFVSGLPHMLIEAFKATLEEAVLADFLVHIIDASSPHAEDRIAVTMGVLSEIGADSKNILFVFNKIDLVTDRNVLERLRGKYGHAHFISTKTGEGIEALLALMGGHLRQNMVLAKFRIPQSNAGDMALLHRSGIVLSKEYEGNTVIIEARVPRPVYGSLEQWLA